jgi:hypothetical protein
MSDKHRTDAHGLVQRLARDRRVRRSDLRDWVRLAVIVTLGLGFVVWWQATQAL